MEHRELRDHGPYRRPDPLLVAPEQYPRPGPQRQGDRLVRHSGVGADEAAQRVRAQRLQVLHRLGRQRREPQTEPLPAHRDPDLREVVVRGAAFPQPGGAHHRRQCAGLGMPPRQRDLLLDERAPHLRPGLPQIAQIVAALALEPALAFAGLAHHLAHHHGARRRQHHGERGVAQRRTAVAHPDEEQHHRRRHHAHRQVVPDGRVVGHDLRQSGRLLQAQLALGHVRGAATGRTAEEDHTQRTDSLETRDPRACDPWGLRPCRVRLFVRRT